MIIAFIVNSLFCFSNSICQRTRFFAPNKIGCFSLYLTFMIISYTLCTLHSQLSYMRKPLSFVAFSTMGVQTNRKTAAKMLCNKFGGRSSYLVTHLRVLVFVVYFAELVVGASVVGASVVGASVVGASVVK